MANTLDSLPEGFVLDELPKGFVIDEVETKKTKKGIDITPSGLLKKGLAGVVSAPLRMAMYGENYKEAYDKAREIQETNPLTKTASLVTDIGAYTLLPQTNVLRGAGLGAKAVNLGLTGATQGALAGGLESLKQRGDLSGVRTGALIGGSIGAGLPVAGKVATETIKLLPKTGNLFAKGIARLKQKTLNQVVKPNSQALDLTEDTAQNLLMDTTERVQNSYNEILDNAGRKVGEEIQKLPEDFAFDNMDLMQTVDNIYNNYSLSGNPKLNVAYNQAGKEYRQLQDFLLNKADVTPQELFDINKNISKMVQWDNPNAKTSNEILEQIYGDFSNRIASLSPELRQANATYSKLADFKKNEGIRKILRPNDNIDSASTALKNYNNTVTKGNTNRNIQDLENILVNNGYEPFLNNIDDVNAAMDLLNIKVTGDSAKANIGTQAIRPLLKMARELNKRNIPQTVQQAGQNIGNFNQRVLPPIMAKTPLLYGGVEYNEGY